MGRTYKDGFKFSGSMSLRVSDFGFRASSFGISSFGFKVVGLRAFLICLWRFQFGRGKSLPVKILFGKLPGSPQGHTGGYMQRGEVVRRSIFVCPHQERPMGIIGFEVGRMQVDGLEPNILLSLHTSPTHPTLALQMEPEGRLPASFQHSIRSVCAKLPWSLL